MNKSLIVLVFGAMIVLTGCAVTVGNQDSSASSRGISQDISSTRDNGPTPGNLEAPVSDKGAAPTTSSDASPATPRR